MCWIGRLRFSTWSPELYPERVTTSSLAAGPAEMEGLAWITSVFVFKGKKTSFSDSEREENRTGYMHEIEQQISGVTIGMVVSRAEGPVSKANIRKGIRGGIPGLERRNQRQESWLLLRLFPVICAGG
uniref:Uncharacterized protein n=1 Tax=Lactuca sativa TaxID=4236 RepID=A0A9R1W080_LACSA|nr:hypothetical protein LSAT_V11C400181870 [Lactuca sativa]